MKMENLLAASKLFIDQGWSQSNKTFYDRNLLA
jgi:hypothetical protein